MADRTNETFFCSECSRDVGEQVFGSAPRTDVWLLLEYTAPWGNKALRESDLSDAVKARLNGWLDSMPHSKFLFIKQNRVSTHEGHAFFVAVSDRRQPRLYRFHLGAYNDLLSLDVPALLADTAAYRDRLVQQPLFAICTNGKRDISCSKFGLPVFHELARFAPDVVWQCSHIGGHRFAGTLVALPQGVAYGRLEADDAHDLLDAHQRGEVVLDKLRGLAFYDKPVQGADYFLRGMLGETRLDAFALAGVEQTGDRQWAVRFTTADGGAHTVRLETRPSPWIGFESSTDAEGRHFDQFHLLGIESA